VVENVVGLDLGELFEDAVLDEGIASGGEPASWDTALDEAQAAERCAPDDAERVPDDVEPVASKEEERTLTDKCIEAE
jgi:hypothetical protein